MNYFYTDQPWVVALYQKRGREYVEVEQIIETSMDPALAFESFKQFANCIPTRQAVLHAVESLEENESTPEYEVRLIRKNTKRVIASVLWDSQTMEECINDYLQSEERSYIITAEVDIPADYDPDNPAEWDWFEIMATGRFELLEVEFIEETEETEEDDEESETDD